MTHIHPPKPQQDLLGMRVPEPPRHISLVRNSAKEQHIYAPPTRARPALELVGMYAALRDITSAKIYRLENRHADLNRFRERVNDREVAHSTSTQRVRQLLDAMAERGYKSDEPADVNNFNRFLDQASIDPSISPATIQRWGTIMSNDLQRENNRFELTALFSRLLTELINEPKQKKSDDQAPARKELYEQRQVWESYAFTEKVTDPEKITRMLEETFEPITSSNNQSDPISQIRSVFAEYEGIKSVDITKPLISKAMQVLVSEDLFAGDKRKALEELRSNDTVLTEMMHVLRSDFDALDEWKWETDPLIACMRRHINGKYRVYLDEDVTQAVFIQIVGIKWAELVKKAFSCVLSTGAWNKVPFDSKLDPEDLIERRQYLPAYDVCPSGRVNTLREDIYNKYFFVRLPEMGGGYDEAESADKFDPNLKNGGAKQFLFRILTTELLLRKQLYSEGTYLQTDFKWFGPSVPHSTLLALFKFFHVPPKWITFFEKFLRPNILFEGVDGEPKKRVRGVPMSHTLSNVFGEILLFTLDFKINQATGSNLYRIFDDIHFWGSTEACLKAWDILKHFAEVMGLELNDEKSAAIVCSTGPPSPTPPGLPSGPVRWGFLELTHDASWIVSEQSLNEHCAEMKLQLSACASIFSFVQAYNTYMRFFLNNLGHPAYCLGRNHLNMVARTLVKIQSNVLLDLTEGKHNNVISYLRDRIKNSPHLKAGDYTVPEGFFYFPVKLGGLDICNPLVSCFGHPAGLPDEPDSLIINARKQDRDEYEEAKREYESGEAGWITLGRPKKFMSWESYARVPPATSRRLPTAYYKLLKLSADDNIELTGEVRRLNRENRQLSNFASSSHMWAFEQFGLEVVEHTGSFYLGERDLLPVGLILLLRKERKRWKG